MASSPRSGMTARRRSTPRGSALVRLVTKNDVGAAARARHDAVRAGAASAAATPELGALTRDEQQQLAQMSRRDREELLRLRLDVVLEESMSTARDASFASGVDFTPGP